MIEAATANWKGTVGLGFKADEFDDYVASLGAAPRWVTGITLHNTGAPTLAGWKSQPSAPSQDARVKQRLKNIAHGYRTKKRPWNAGPHLFVDDEKIWVFTPLDQFGIHSPSWNKTHWGAEAVGDWEHEAPPQGLVDNVVAAIAVLCEWAGLDPNVVRLHKEDGATTHDCPGDKLEMLKSNIIISAKKAMESSDDEHTLQPVKDDELEGAYTVEQGDTLFGIARRFRLRVGDLVAANGGSLIRPGQKILLRPDVEEDAPPAPPPTPVLVNADQRISEKMEAWTIQKEGLSLVPYKDSGGIWHIGIGEKSPDLTETSPPLASKDEALARFRKKMVEFEGYVNKMVTVPLSQSHFDALAGGLVYNIGPTLFSKSSVLRALNAGDYVGARAAFLNFHRAGGKPNVLTKRREAEQKVWDGDYGDVSTIPIYTEAVAGKLGKSKREPFPWKKESENA